MWWMPLGFKLLLILTENVYSYTKSQRYQFPSWAGGVWQVVIITWNLHCNREQMDLPLCCSLPLKVLDYCSVCLAQCLFKGFLISLFFHISQNMKSKSYLLLKEQVVLCEAAFPLLSLLAMLMKFSAVILIDPLQFKSRVLSRCFWEHNSTLWNRVGMNIWCEIRRPDLPILFLLFFVLRFSDNCSRAWQSATLLPLRKVEPFQMPKSLLIHWILSRS